MLEKGIDVPRSVVVVAQVVGVLPHIAGEDGFKPRRQNIMVSLDAEDTQQSTHRIHPHNSPTTSLYPHCHGSKGLLKPFHAPKRMVDRIGQSPLRCPYRCPGDALPVKTMQDVSTQIKGEQTSGIRCLLRSKFAGRHSLQGVRRRIRSGHVCRVVFVVMQQDGFLVQQRLQ